MVLLRHFTILILCFSYAAVGFAGSQVNQIRVWAEPDKTRIVFDVTQPIDYQLVNLNDPKRIALDLPNATWKAKIDERKLKGSTVENVQIINNNKSLRVVFNLNAALQAKVFSLKPNETYGHRLVLDLVAEEKEEPVAAVEKAQPKPIRSVRGQREFIVAIDAGHGGEDPGAIGKKYKTHEKEIVLSVARKLQAIINRHPDMQAILLRQSDYYIDLRDRVKLARRFGADLFISLHADSFKDSKAQGASVFVLSERGASSEAAKWLAEKENRSDLIGGVTLDNKSNVLASVLLDLSQTATQAGSQELGDKVIRSLGRVTSLHHREVQRAGFVVLKSPDIPSILVELGFLSNPKSEALLRDPRHQLTLAQAIRDGIEGYIKPRPKPHMEPQYAWMSRQRHLVQSGETLASIAQQYNVSIEKLKQMNSLSEAPLQVGQKIIIPFKLEG